ncbi:MAG: hypothetical protein JST00_03145 [Deltaproteobacteria bacterium]|nr:hypothetical protein [Deltaproteobacteria bacterium]
MTKRAGATEKVSISIPRSDLAALRRRARRVHDGNLSAVIAELAADAALLEAMHELVHELGGSSLTELDRAALDAEWAAASIASPGKRGARTKKKSAA